MPPGTGVVGAFKSTLLVVVHALLLIFPIDFMRHGKQHQNENTRDLPQNTVTHIPGPTAAPRIVVQDRKEKSTMPTFKGLEHFKLQVKMGECVSDYLSITSLFLTVTFLLQWCLFKRLQSSRNIDRQPCC